MIRAQKENISVNPKNFQKTPKCALLPCVQSAHLTECILYISSLSMDEQIDILVARSMYGCELGYTDTSLSNNVYHDPVLDGQVLELMTAPLVK